MARKDVEVEIEDKRKEKIEIEEIETERVVARIDLRAVEKNFAAMKERLREGVKMVAVIKANGYGHGAAPIAHHIESYDYLWGFAVATPGEALSLRRAGIKKPILILGLVTKESLPALVRAGVRIAVSNLELAKSYAKAGREAGCMAYIHLAVDTGMSRIGFADREESLPVIKEISSLEGLTIEGAFTHFARADETDISPALVQLERFQSFCDLLEKNGISLPLRHCSNSAGILRLPQAGLSMVRAGITIYGIYPSDEVEREVPLYPVMELKSHVTFVKQVEAGTQVSYGGTFVAKKKTTLATIPVGYADGYPRSLSSKGYVLIHGQKAPICGRVCMDQFMVDVSEIPGVNIGEEVTLMGRDGDAFLGVDELGALSGRFPYEFVCCISERVPRVYID